jgi:hypothetical protein
VTGAVPVPVIGTVSVPVSVTVPVSLCRTAAPVDILPSLRQAEPVQRSLSVESRTIQKGGGTGPVKPWQPAVKAVWCQFLPAKAGEMSSSLD